MLQLSSEFSPAEITDLCAPASTDYNKGKPPKMELTHGCQTINSKVTTTASGTNSPSSTKFSLHSHSHQQAAPKSPTRSTKRQLLLVVCVTINAQAAADSYNYNMWTNSHYHKSNVSSKRLVHLLHKFKLEMCVRDFQQNNCNSSNTTNICAPTHIYLRPRCNRLIFNCAAYCTHDYRLFIIKGIDWVCSSKTITAAALHLQLFPANCRHKRCQRKTLSISLPTFK